MHDEGLKSKLQQIQEKQLQTLREDDVHIWVTTDFSNMKIVISQLIDNAI